MEGNRVEELDDGWQDIELRSDVPALPEGLSGSLDFPGGQELGEGSG